MKVHEAMSKIAVTCTPATTVSEAAALLWNHHCACLPVVDAANGQVGIVTDRDLLLALASRNLRPADLAVGDVMTGNFPSCHPEDDAEDALRLLEQKKLQCIPVLAEDGSLAGVLDLHDLILRARQRHFSAASALRRAAESAHVPHLVPVV